MALPGLALNWLICVSLSCLVLPGLAKPRFALPGLDLTCLAWLCFVLAGLALTGLALPCFALPWCTCTRLTWPGLVWNFLFNPASLGLACSGNDFPGMPGLALGFLLLPGFILPCLALYGLAWSHLAEAAIACPFLPGYFLSCFAGS